jgi:putative ABC transport system permease protein
MDTQSSVSINVIDSTSTGHRGSTMSALSQDIRHAFRSFPKSVGFTVTAILTFALGIGTNVAIFSVVNAVLLRPLPFKQPAQLVSVWANGGPSRGVFATIRDDSRSYQQIAAYQEGAGLTLTGLGEPERIDGASGTATLFLVLGVAPVLGRNFAPSEEQPGADHVVILSNDFWQQHFGADPHVVGRTVTLDGISRTVIGVMPAEFHFPVRTTQVWIPVVMDAAKVGDFWGSGGYRIIARLRSGATVTQAQAEVRALGPRIRHANPVWDAGPRTGMDATVLTLQTQISGDVRPTLLILLAAVAVVLLIACANVANLLLARGAAQSKAIAIRAALGAHRRRLISQLITESLLLSLLGAAVGAAIAWMLIKPLTSGLMAGSPQLVDVGIDGRVFAFTVIVAVLTGVTAGLMPALRTSDPTLQSLLNESGRGASGGVAHRRLSDILVISEITLAVMLVVGAGLLIRSFWELQNVKPGFNPAGVTSARIDLSKATYANDDLIRNFYTELLQRVGSLPDMKGVAATTEIPLGEQSGMAFRVQGQIEDLRNVLPTAGGYHVITPEYLHTMGIPLLKGRGFTDADAKGAPDVVLVNEALARRYWPNTSPVGQRIGYPWPSGWLTIVGVVANVKEQGIGGPSDSTMTIYRPFLQSPKATMVVVVRSDAPTAALAKGIRRAAERLDPTVPVSHVQTMEQVVAISVSKQRFTMLLLSAFAGVALLLGAIGIYGVVNYSVTQRNKEIGIRMALGAKEYDILRMVIHRGAVLASAGALVGLVVSFAAMRTLSSLLYGITAADPATFIAAPVLLVAVAVLASYVPARRAASSDPVTILNAE